MKETAKPAPVETTKVYHNVFYQPPPSVKPEDWTSFDTFTTRVFKSEFTHDQNLTVNVRIPTIKEGYVKVKQQLNWKDGLHVNDELRLWFPMTLRRGSYIYAHKVNNKIKIHYDHGYIKQGDYNINAYGSLDFFKNWSNVNVRVGASHTSSRVHTNTKLKVDEDKTATLYHKTHLRFNEWKFGFQGVVDLAKKSLIKKDVVIGYEKPEYAVYLKGEQTWDRPTHDLNQWRQFFSHVNLTGLWRRTPRQLYGVQIVADPHGNALSSATALVQYQHSHRNRVKAKLNNRFLFTLLLDRKINSQLNVQLGLELPLQKKNQNKERRQTKVGLKFSWNL